MTTVEALEDERSTATVVVVVVEVTIDSVAAAAPAAAPAVAGGATVRGAHDDVDGDGVGADMERVIRLSPVVPAAAAVRSMVGRASARTGGRGAEADTPSDTARPGASIGVLAFAPTVLVRDGDADLPPTLVG